MAKIKLSESTFKLIDEGVHIFKVISVDDSKYEDFGKLAVQLQTAKGDTHTEHFSLIKANGEINQGGLNAWSFFARTCLNNNNVDEIDTQDIVDCYIQATVRHETYTITKGDNAGKQGTSARLGKYKPAFKFEDKKPVEPEEEKPVDVDGFFNE